jgi:biopolymer transport protein TolQ
VPEQQLSILSLVIGASVPVQLVMFILLIASMASCLMIGQRWWYSRQMNGGFKAFETNFWSGVDLNELFRDGSLRLNDNESVDGVENVFRSGFREFNRLTKNEGTDPDAVMEGTERAMRVALSREEEKLNTHLPFLASVASVSPYIGLFGTVWGIMQSFRGLATMQQATLAVVAPGISEALIATAMGLFAAIPAVLAYNRFSADADALYSRYDTFSDEFTSILHRRVHSG